MTFKSLDRIARCKRFRTSEIEALTCDLLSVKLENSSERNHVLIPVNTADRVAAAFDTSYFPEKAIIWFELPASAVAGRKATAIAAHATSLKKKILLDNSSAAVAKKNVIKKSIIRAVTSMNIDKINPLKIDLSGSSSSNNNTINSTTTRSLQLPIALSSRSTDETQEQSATNVGVTVTGAGAGGGGGGGVRTDPRISGPRASVTFQIPKKTTTGEILEFNFSNYILDKLCVIVLKYVHICTCVRAYVRTHVRLNPNCSI